MIHLNPNCRETTVDWTELLLLVALSAFEAFEVVVSLMSVLIPIVFFVLALVSGPF